MKRIRTHSTLVSAKHGLVANGQSTNSFKLAQRASYSYELQVQAPWATACSGTCDMATPTCLRFQQGVQTSVVVPMTGGFGRFQDSVLASTPPTKGQQKIELVATVNHTIGNIQLKDAFSVRVG
jgi:hypothetical protein